MRVQTLFLAAASVAFSMASLDERGLKECASIALDLEPALSEIPTPASGLASFLASQTRLATMTQPCVLPTVTGSMADEYSSFVNSLTSWQDKHKDEFSSLLSACSDVPQVQSLLDQLPAEASTLCSNIAWETGSASNSKDSSTKNANAASASQTNSDNAAPRETGMALAAAAVAGLVVVGVY